MIDAEARPLILAEFHTGVVLFADDISEILDLPMDQVMRICDDLLADGEIGNA